MRKREGKRTIISLPPKIGQHLKELEMDLKVLEVELKEKAKRTLKEKIIFVLTHRISLSFFFSSVILLYLAFKIDYGALQEHLAEMRLLPLFLAFMAMVGIVHLRALRWYFLLKMEYPQLKFGDFIFPFYLGDALSVFVPMKLGEAFAMGIPVKYLKVSLSNSLSTTWFYRIFDMTLITMTVLIFFPLLFHGTTGFELVITITTLVFLFFLYAILNKEFGFRVVRLLHLRFLEDMLETIYDDIRNFKASAFLGTLFLSVMVWALFVSMLTFIMVGFMVDVSLTVIIAAVGIYVAVGVPLSSAGIGAGTLGSVYVLYHAGEINEDLAFSIMIVYGFIIAIVQGLLGFVGNVMTHSMIEKKFEDN